MVSSQLLALVDVKLREVVRDLQRTKRDANQDTRPFGGLNVMLLGDFWQLPPPSGGCLSDIPVDFIQRARQYQPSPTVSHGQSLMWGGKECGIQGSLSCHRLSDARMCGLGKCNNRTVTAVCPQTIGTSCMGSQPPFLEVGRTIEHSAARHGAVR